MKMTADIVTTADARPLWRGRLDLALAWLVSAAFALSFGWSYATSNQAVYFVPSLRLLEPDLLRLDWYETQTMALHPTFRPIGAALLALDRDGWGVAIAFSVIVASGMFCTFFVLRACAGARLALPAFLLLAALVFRTRTFGPATTYVFDSGLQPSTLSSAWFLAAVPCFVRGRFVASGVLIALSGLCHVNLLVLFLGAFGLSHLLLGKRELVRRGLQQLAPLTLVLLGFLPMLLAAAKPASDPALVQRIYQELRFPHHFLIRERLAEFMPLLVWQFLGTAVVLPLARLDAERPLARLLALATGLSVVVWAGVFGTLLDARLTQLFSWRIAPHAELLFQMGVVAVLVRAILDRSLLERYGLRARILLGFCMALAGVSYALARHHAVVELLVIFAAALALFGLPSVRPRAERLLLGVSALVVLAYAVEPVLRFPRHSNLFAAPDAERRLYTWMRTGTPRNASFLSPPELECVRLLGERATLVDWKAAPGLAAELLEWYRRLEDVTGRPGLARVEELSHYDALDEARLARLRARYAFDHVVVRRGREAALSPRPRVYENEKYVVVRL